MEKVKILNEEYEVLDALNNITLADSFLKNKNGTGNGEAKLYVGNESDELKDFFDDFPDSINGFFLKKDLNKMLEDLKQEFEEPQSRYFGTKTINKVKSTIDITKDMPQKWKNLKCSLNNHPDKLIFEFYKSKVNPPRIYINSNSIFYKLLRNIGIPNISYLSILKLKTNSNVLVYYFKPFVTYSNDLISYEHLSKKEANEIKEIDDSNKSKTNKDRLISSRLGQGKYREKLFEDMPFCPFTKINDERLLRASHIKPWVDSNDKEKIDPKNGLTLSPTYDVLFDRGFITFENDGTLLVSPFISPMNQKRLNIKTGAKIKINMFLDKKRISYMEYHRQNIFQGI